MIHSVRDPYLLGFLRNLFKSDACEKCKFSLFPRQSDFTIGDFWHINKYDEKITTDKGISCIMPNNNKAIEIFKNLSSKFAYIQGVPLSFLVSHNQVYEKRKVSLAKPRFFNLLKLGWDFKKAVDYSINWRFDIGLTGCWTINNYGGEFTYYAFYNVLKEMGYTVLMIERRIDIPNYDIPDPTLFKKNPYPFYDVCRIHKSFMDQSELNERVKTFILGSDQVWNYELMEEEIVDSYSLDYVKSFRKKISYATSFGGCSFIGTDDQKRRLEKNISSFDYVSVRERSGVGICAEIGRKSEWVLDPIFLCKKQVYYDLVKNCDLINKKNYLFSYLIWPNSNKYGLDNICHLVDLEDYVCVVNADKISLSKINFSEKTWPYNYEKDCCLEQWLHYIMNSSFVVTDSFHAVCLSLIFHKPFIFIKGHLTAENGLDRITDILETVGLSDLIADSVYDAIEKRVYNREIKWTDVDERLNIEIERSRKWLIDAIESPLKTF